MPLLRLAYITQFLIALIAVFVLWSEVGGQSHLDLMPWYWKLTLGGGAAFAAVKATMAAVGREKPWNGQSLRWLGVMLALLACCGLASYYAHLNEETDQDDEEQQTGSLTSELQRPFAPPPRRVLWGRLSACGGVVNPAWPLEDLPAGHSQEVCSSSKAPQSMRDPERYNVGS